MNFVRAETLVQEITADGKVRDIVTERVRTTAEKEEAAKEDVLRNLPEFKQLRGEGVSLGEQIAGQTSQEFEEEKEKPKEYNFHTIDEDEYEHYQRLEESERGTARKRASDDMAAVESFESEQKRFREGEQELQARKDILSQMQQHKRDKALEKARAAPTAADRLRGRITVVAARPPPLSASTGDSNLSTRSVGGCGPDGQLHGVHDENARTCGSAAVRPGAGGLVAYASDSDE
eukprot:TRINITY_DN61308_c0_g1_i1.p1 TRINITY_DN61308_c0_g1~~TRINITY_DN61308_c0_g1_i1.p1  ORF type:complete len:234 (+),score=41.75 TRINITY_DN61308_c0_g1_i1:150-851(+)